MAQADPAAQQDATAVLNLKAIGDVALNVANAFAAISQGATQNYMATMDALNKSMVNNLDFAAKVMATRLEVDPIEASAAAILMQQGVKAAQTTPPPTP
jgi:hypothetical protein